MTPHRLSELLRELLGDQYFNEGGEAVLYGSTSDGRDIDILLVQEEEPPAAVVVSGQLDIYVLSRKTFTWLLDLLDPHVTEPVLTGSVLIGDEGRWRELHDSLENTRGSRDAVWHACRRSLVEYLNAEELHRAASTLTGRLEWAFQTLSFSISYACFASHYSSGGSVCTLRDLAKARRLLMPEFWEFRTTVKNGAATLEPSDVEQWLRRWAEHLCVSQMY